MLSKHTLGTVSTISAVAAILGVLTIFPFYDALSDIQRITITILTSISFLIMAISEIIKSRVSGEAKISQQKRAKTKHQKMARFSQMSFIHFIKTTLIPFALFTSFLLIFSLVYDFKNATHQDNTFMYVFIFCVFVVPDLCLFILSKLNKDKYKESADN